MTLAALARTALARKAVGPIPIGSTSLRRTGVAGTTEDRDGIGRIARSAIARNGVDVTGIFRTGAVAIAALLLVSTQAAAQQGGVQRTAGGVQIDFQNTDMRLVVAALAEAAGLNVIYADLPQRPVTLRTGQPVPMTALRGYLESLLRANSMELREEQGGLLRIVGTGAPEGGAAQPQAQQQPVYAPGQGGVQLFVHPLRHAPADDIARSIGALFGIGDGSFGGAERPRSLTEELRGIQGPGEMQPGMQQSGAGPARALSAGLGGPVQIFPDQRTNSLLIRASPADYATIRAAVEQLDTRPLQVLIEVVIAEVRRDRQFALGVDVEVPESRVPGSDVTIGGDLLGGDAGDVVLRVMRLGGVDANVVLRALSSSGTVHVLSRPVILAQNNEEARIMVGDQRPFIQISRSLPTDGAVRDQVIQYRDVGTQLTIRPTINPDGYVTLTVLQEVSTATEQTQFGAPVISTREAETRLLVKDGHTVVIGGLIDQQRSNTNSGIPILRDIPILGHLFRSTTRRNNVSELFLFLVPHVLYSDDDVDAATDRIRDRSPRLDKSLPDSIPLYWDIRRDTTGAPAAPRRPGQPQAPRPQANPQGGAPNDAASNETAFLAPAAARQVARRRGRRIRRR